MIAGSAGTTSIFNSGSGALFGPQGSGGNLTIGDTGTTFVVNNGVGSMLGPTGLGGNMTIQDPGSTIVINSGLGTRLGPTGEGGNLTLLSGSIINSLGATVSAGPGGTFTISGGTINNDLTSTVGAPNQNIVFTGGSINDSGNIVAFDFTQGAGATLQLNLTSLPTIFGNVVAGGTAAVNVNIKRRCAAWQCRSRRICRPGLRFKRSYWNFSCGELP